jgi:TRAP-type C4-dicarboxylate transport system substrate-binding protein
VSFFKELNKPLERETTAGVALWNVGARHREHPHGCPQARPDVEL